MKDFDFSYDKVNDDLFMYYPKSKSKGSVEIGNIIIDYNAKKEIVAIQLLNASRIIKDMLVDEKIDMKQFLVNLKNCKVSIKTDNSLTIMKFYLTGDSKKIMPVISMPNMVRGSPALACA
ncbi:MAG: DUF2283 domain-containing protein [Candidatus Aenigmarchaeota archaeon]|nr:DUF2283 domain-containing protein [Candidatus Aenigmarchaeota archaeon]